jgi:hypothetical protein
MRLVLSSLIVGALAAGSAGSLIAQHGGGEGHRGGAQAPAAPSIGVRQGHGAVAPIGPAPIGLQPQGAGYTGINPGALNSSNTYIGGGRNGYIGTPQRGGEHRGDRDHDRRSRNSYGYGFGGGYLYAPYYPYSDYSSIPNDYGYGYGPSDDAAAQTAQVTANLLGEQLQRLTSEVQELRNEQQGANAPRQYEAPGHMEPDPAANPITLVLKNGQQMKIQSYAVMDGSFWDFSKQPARRIPLSNIDVSASTKATDAAGGDFPELR